MDKLRYELETVIRTAGVVLRNAHANEQDISNKAGIANFVTKYDVMIQEMLEAGFREVLPEAEFLGEEGEKSQNSWEGYTFIIDPIDGTTNFIFDYHHSCISVGLAWKKEMVMAFIYNPYREEMYFAEKGKGAWLNDRPLKNISQALSEGIATFGCARYNSESTERIFAVAKELYLRSLCVRECGSAALDLAAIAAGRNCIYVEMRLQPWDYAAASLVIEEAGGKITQCDGTPITIDEPCSILAGTSKSWEEGKEILDKIP